MDVIKELREMEQTISREIAEANQRIRESGGDMNTADIEIIDKLTHSMKSLATAVAMLEAEDGDSYSNGRYNTRNNGRDGYSGNTYGYGRERRNNYGYSRNGSMQEHLRQLMDEAPDEQTRMEIKRLMDRVG